jgi:hypothetical protein
MMYFGRKNAEQSKKKIWVETYVMDESTSDTL